MRYVATLDLPVADLTAFPGNASRGDVDAIAASLAKGQYRAVIVAQEYEGQPYVVVAGNHTVYTARLLGWDTIRAERHEMTSAEARRVNLADNRMSELGGYSEPDLAALMQAALIDDPNLDGTGWAPADLDELLAKDLADLPDELPLETDHGDGDHAATLHRLTFGKVKVLRTEEETASLTAVWRAYLDQHGTDLGFGRHLADHAKAAKAKAAR